jgi:hypothetical protein
VLQPLKAFHGPHPELQMQRALCIHLQKVDSHQPMAAKRDFKAWGMVVMSQARMLTTLPFWTGLLLGSR